MHEQNVRRDSGGGDGKGSARRRRAAPALERLRHKLLHLRVRHVPRDHEQRPGGPQALAGELRDVVAGDGAIALARRTPPVRVAAVDLLAEEPLRHGARLGQLQRERG